MNPYGPQFNAHLRLYAGPPPCHTCDGTGQVFYGYSTGADEPAIGRYHDCPRCGGHGYP